MVKRVFQVASLAIMMFLWWDIWSWYLVTHGYYQTLLENGTNRNIVLSGLLFSLLPWAYLVFGKKTKLLPLLLLFFIGLVFFGLVFTMSKWAVGWSLMLGINSAILIILALFMFLSLTTAGTLIKKHIFSLETTSITDVLLSLWIGLSFFLLLNYLLINLNLFYPIVSWIQVLAMIMVMGRKHEAVTNLRTIVENSFSTKELTLGHKLWLLLLFCITCLYIYLWFYLSDIAYSTAWDANHAYMFYPKMWALNNGYYRDEIGMRTWFQLRYAFIAFWFSLFTPTAGIGWIAVDTIAISMNFWSSLFVLLFGLGLLSKLLELVGEYAKDHKHSFLIFLLGWLLWLLRLSSGMGAFLVFVDNKTDLGVMALIILAIWSGLIAIGSIDKQQWRVRKKKLRSRNTLIDTDDTTIWTTDHWKRWLTKHQAMLLILSWFFYAIAGMAKQTALFDVANFGIFAIRIWIGPLWALAIVLLLIGIMSIIKFRWIEWYIGPLAWKVLGWGGIMSGILQLMLGQRSTFKKYWAYLLVRGISFLWVYLVFKVPFHAAKVVFFEEEVSPGKFIERVLFSDTEDTGLDAGDQVPLFAQLGVERDLVEQCTIQGQWLDSPDWLYEWLLSAPWDTYAEDVGRYVWFGRKWNDDDLKRNIPPFINPRRWFLFWEWCSSFPTWIGYQAKVLCENEALWKSWDLQQVQQVQALTEQNPTWSSGLISLLSESGSLATGDQNLQLMQELEDLMQWNSARVVLDNTWNKEIYLPYKYLNFFNITFNRSLQNISSYYTDIGIIRLLLIIFSVVWLFYGIISKNKILTWLEIVTIFGWMLWFFIGWGILRYGIWIIVRSIMSFVAFMYAMTNGENNQGFGWLTLIVFLFFAFMQLGYNMIRISSQWWWAPFMRYKSNTWMQNIINEQLQSQSVIDTDFRAKDIFNLQFPHYNKFINAMNKSSPDEGAFIAGTYARYFVNDQSNITYDQFLTRMWEMSSDEDTCSTYLRFKDKNKKYIVIDPNIGTVVQWSGNRSLFDRFFARTNEDATEILDAWVMTTLAKMVEEWYLKLFSTNSLGSKYAYILPNSTFGVIDDQTRILERAKLSVPRFRWESTFNNIMTIAAQRIDDWSFLEDIADMTGKQIRPFELRSIVSEWSIDPTKIAWLSQDERFVLLQYLSLRKARQDNFEWFENQLVNLIKSNIQSWSQIIVLEVQ